MSLIGWAWRRRLAFICILFIGSTEAGRPVQISQALTEKNMADHPPPYSTDAGVAPPGYPPQQGYPPPQQGYPPPQVRVFSVLGFAELRAMNFSIWLCMDQVYAQLIVYVFRVHVDVLLRVSKERRSHQ